MPPKLIHLAWSHFAWFAKFQQPGSPPDLGETGSPIVLSGTVHQRKVSPSRPTQACMHGDKIIERTLQILVSFTRRAHKHRGLGVYLPSFSSMIDSSPVHHRRDPCQTRDHGPCHTFV